MNLNEAREIVRTHSGTVAEQAEAGWLLHVRLGEIERRAQQIRGGLKPYARPPEVVDFLLAEPEEA